MNRPDLLIMDEPSAGLDPLVQHEFHTLLREVAARGGTVFLSSHTLSEVQRVADRVGIIRSGHLVAVEDVTALRGKAIRRIELEYATELQPSGELFAGIAGVRDAEVEGRRVRLAFEGKTEELIRAALSLGELVDISTQEADLEEIFLAFYRDDEQS